MLAYSEDWRGVSFWWWSCSCQPESQRSEENPDHRRILERTDDPPRPLACRTDQGISFVSPLTQAWPHFSCTPFPVPAGQGGRGERPPDRPSGVFPVRRCWSLPRHAPSALPGSGYATTSPPAIESAGTFLGVAPSLDRRPGQALDLYTTVPS